MTPEVMAAGSRTPPRIQTCGGRRDVRRIGMCRKPPIWCLATRGRARLGGDGSAAQGGRAREDRSAISESCRGWRAGCRRRVPVDGDGLAERLAAECSPRRDRGPDHYARVPRRPRGDATEGSITAHCRGAGRPRAPHRGELARVRREASRRDLLLEHRQPPTCHLPARDRHGRLAARVRVAGDRPAAPHAVGRLRARLPLSASDPVRVRLPSPTAPRLTWRHR
jgi:hypothetical protein